MKEICETCETCKICNNNYVLTFKTPDKICTVSCNDSDMMLHEVLQDLVLPAVQGVGFSVSPGYLDVCYHEENSDTL